MDRLALSILSILAVTAGCGARSSLLDGAPLPSDAAVHDAATVDARRPDASARDAAPEATTADAAADAIDAAVGVDAGGDAGADADAAACDRTGAPPGTITTIVPAPDSGIVDFDVGCSGVYFATAAGEARACPLGGCAVEASRLLVAASGVSQVRLGAGGLVMLTRPSAPPYGPSQVQLESLDGGAPSVLATPPSGTDADVLPGVGVEGCGTRTIGTTPTHAYFVEGCTVGGLPSYEPVSIDVVSDGGAVRATSVAGGEFVVAGGELYTSPHNSPLAGGYTVFRTDLDDAGASSLYAQVPGAFSKWGLQATDAFVLFPSALGSDTLSWDPPVACPPTSCTAPVRVTGLANHLPYAAWHDTLWVRDWVDGGEVGPSVSTCTAASLLDGTCVPTFFADLPSSNRIVATAANLYLLTPSGILRVAR